jgi:hypothetical protein
MILKLLSSLVNLPCIEPLRSKISCELSFVVTNVYESWQPNQQLVLRGLVACLFHIVQITVCKSDYDY